MLHNSATVTRILYSKNTNTLEYNPFLKTNSSDKYQHIYILSDEDIKEGDWYIHFNTYTKESSLFKSDDKFNEGNNPNIIDKRDFVYEYWNKKIIATTDTSLKIHHFNKGVFKNLEYLLPQPSQEFIEKYIEEYNKGNVISSVEVEYEVDKYDIRNQYKHTPSGKYHDDEPIPPSPDRLFSNPSYFITKINSDNTINIKLIKNSWSREEVKQLCKLGFKYHCDNSRTTSLPDKWIEENL